MNLLELRILGACGAVFILALVYGAWHHKVDKAGYDRCQSEHVQVAQKAQQTAHVKIKQNEVKHEAQKKAVYTVQGGNPAAGPRVSAAIGGLPDGSSHR